MKEAKKCSRILPPQWIRPELSNFSFRKVLVTERSEPLRAGDFVLRTTSVSTLDLDKGQRPLTPRRMLTHSSVSARSAILGPGKKPRAFFRISPIFSGFRLKNTTIVVIVSWQDIFR